MARRSPQEKKDLERAIQAETVEELTIGNMRAIDRVAPADKYGGGETLEQHLQRQAARRSKGRKYVADDGWTVFHLGKNSAAVYNEAKHHRLLHDLFRFYASLFTSTSLAKPWLRRDLDTIARLADSPLLSGFLRTEPRWKRELEVWQKRVLLLKNS